MAVIDANVCPRFEEEEEEGGGQRQMPKSDNPASDDRSW